MTDHIEQPSEQPPEPEDEFKDIKAYVEFERQQDVDLGMGIRWKVIKTALRIEMIATQVLGTILGINPQTSRVIGHKGSPMSFRQKMLLMVEVAALDDKDIKMFDHFMEIRNTFAHDLRSVSVDACFDLIDARDEGRTRRYVMKIVNDPKWTGVDLDTMTDSLKLEMGVQLLGLTVYGRSSYALKVSEERQKEKVGAIIGSEAYTMFADEHQKPFTELIGRLMMAKGKLILTDTMLEEVEKLSRSQWELMNELWSRVDQTKVTKFIYPAHRPEKTEEKATSTKTEEKKD